MAREQTAERAADPAADRTADRTGERRADGQRADEPSGPPAGRPGPRERRAWRAAGVLTAVVVVLTGAGQAWASLAEQTSSRPTRFPGAITTVELDLQDAVVTVAAGTGRELTVREDERWTMRRPEVTQRVAGQTLRISARCPRVLGISEAACRVALDIVVPPTTDVTVKSTSGETRIKGLSGDLSLRTTSGSIQLDGDSGRIAAQLTSGVISGRHLTSSEVQASATSGEVDLHFAAPPNRVALATTSGSLSVGVPPGSTYRVTASTGSGGKDVDPALDDPTATRAITVTADSGHATLGYESGG